MTDATADAKFRAAAEAEGGRPVSAGARLAHVKAAVDAGRALYVDLSGVPEDKRAQVVTEIEDLVRRASTAA